MKEKLAMLVQLQEIDLKRQKEKEELERFPEKMELVEKPVREARANVLASQESLECLEKERREKELALKVVEDKIVKLKGRLLELKTNKEYHAHLQEIAAANREKSETEDRLLMAMEESDLLKKELAANKNTLAEQEAQFSEVESELKAHLNQVSKTVSQMEKDWLVLSQKIPKDLLASYKRLFLNRKGLAVVSLNGYTCTGCHFSLPPQLIAEVKKGEKIHACNYCHRILYFQSP